MSAPFIHLRVHSEFSLVDGLVRLPKLYQMLNQQSVGAVALTDQSNLFALIKFYQGAQNTGIKPICGIDLWLEPTAELNTPSRILLLAVSETGYRNLIALSSLVWQQGQKQNRAFAKWQWLEQYAKDLIVLSGGAQGELGQHLLAGDQNQAEQVLQKALKVFPNRFYIELIRTGKAAEEAYIQKAMALARDYQCPVVATNDVCFLHESDYEAHETRVCIGEGSILDDTRRQRLYTQEQYFKTPEQMQELFADIPEALSNSVEIAKRCNIHIPLGKNYLPDYPIPEGKTLDEFFCELSRQGLFRRLEKDLDQHAENYPEKKQQYLDRLQFELDTILQMGFAGYFLVVMDFIKWAKDNQVPVGPGRGSGAGSLVAYALNINDIDPIPYHLLFERFLNPERVSMPDFDIDFCMESRDRVIDYVATRYGRDAVSQIATFGTMAAKAVVRDVARVQGKSYGLADRLSKMIPFAIGMTLEKAFEQEEALRNFLAEDEGAQEIWEMGLKLEGITRNTGKHAGGVVIAPTKLTDFTPLYCDDEGKGLITQYDKNDVETVGLVKFDFLGLRTLTIIDWTLATINEQRKAKGRRFLEIENIDLGDAGAYALLQKAKTTAVFQLESRGMKDLIKRLQPSCFEDIIALLALFRPGPLQSGMVDDFINRKQGRAKIAYPHPEYQHPSLETILKPTYGIIVYQEQVMQIAQALAGYSLGEADLLRRAMGKKKPEEMAKQREIFKQGAIKSGVDGSLAMKIFDLVEKFAGYGFNKSHSAAYALVSYQTLWLKTYFPAPFMAAVLSSEMHNTDKVVVLIKECNDMKISLLPPDVNQSSYKFTVNDQEQILYGLGAIKGVGEGPVDVITQERQTKGSFKDLFDFCERVRLGLNKRVLEALIRSGALDSLSYIKGDLNQIRATLAAEVEQAVKAAEQSARNLESGAQDLFASLMTPEPSTVTEPNKQKVEPWQDEQRLKGEKDTLGAYLSGHPMDQYVSEVKHFISKRIADLKPAKQEQTFAGLIVASRSTLNKQKQKIAFITLEDQTGQIEVALFSEECTKYQSLLGTDNFVVIKGEISFDEYSEKNRVRAKQLLSLEQARSDYAQYLSVQLDHKKVNDKLIHSMKRLLQSYAGTVPVVLEYQNTDCRVSLSLDLQILPTKQLLQDLQQVCGRLEVNLVYNR